MRLIIILFILSTGNRITQAQLNYEGNPLTENNEYTAEETQLSGRNSRQNLQLYEITDGRRVSGSKDVSDSIRPTVNIVPQNRHLSHINNQGKNGQQSQDMTKISSMKDEFTGIKTNDVNVSNQNESRGQVDQLQEYPIQSQRMRSYQFPITQQSPQVFDHRSYNSLDQGKNLETYSTSRVSTGAGEALNMFLNSRTPEESQIALQKYIQMQELNARQGNQQSGSADRFQSGQQRIIEQTGSVVSNTVPSHEHYLSQGIANGQAIQSLSSGMPSSGLYDESSKISHSTGQQYGIIQHASPRWNHLGIQSRRDALVGGPSGRRPSRYWGQMPGRIRGKPWAQSRIGPGPVPYHHKGPIFGGGGGPPPSFSGNRHPPVEVIYTRPPGLGHGPSPPSNPPVPYEDASHWFPDSDQPPPQKDVYYSQLYSQSYDPHYYNYVAKTGKIKPWLYGKLGKHEEKSIWWELFAGFKKHGMKNIMNPMFLLGMTIPTLTLMLTALVQKRSLGRSDSGSHVTEEMIEEYLQRIQEAIECYEKESKENNAEKCW